MSPAPELALDVAATGWPQEMDKRWVFESREMVLDAQGIFLYTESTGDFGFDALSP